MLIEKRRVVERVVAEHGCKAYRLGEPRRKVKVLGLKARSLITDGRVEFDVKEQASDIDDGSVRALSGLVKGALERCLQEKGVPLVARVAADLGLLGCPDEGGGSFTPRPHTATRRGRLTLSNTPALPARLCVAVDMVALAVATAGLGLLVLVAMDVAFKVGWWLGG